jgi:hypothetical protein
VRRHVAAQLLVVLVGAVARRLGHRVRVGAGRGIRAHAAPTARLSRPVDGIVGAVLGHGGQALATTGIGSVIGAGSPPSIETTRFATVSGSLNSSNACTRR